MHSASANYIPYLRQGIQQCYFHRYFYFISTRSSRRPQIFAKAADPAKFVEMYFSATVKISLLAPWCSGERAVMPRQGPGFNPRPGWNLYGKFRISGAPIPLSYDE